MTDSRAYLFYDGDCGLCSETVQWILRHERDASIYFIPLQNEFSRQFLTEKLGSYSMDTVVFFKNEKIYTKSNAILKTITHLKLPLRILLIIFVIPRPLRDWAYQFIAKRRLTFFGQKCYLPDAKTRHRFINSID